MRCFDPDFSATITSLKWIENANPPFFLMKQNSIPACLADVSFNGAVVEALRKQHVQSCSFMQTPNKAVHLDLYWYTLLETYQNKTWSLGTSPNSTWTSDAFRQRHGENCLALLQNKLLPHLLRYFRCCSRSFWCLRNRWPKHAAKPNQSEVVPPFLHACCVTFTTGLQTAFPELPIISIHSS